jgi:hypothetical protein
MKTIKLGGETIEATEEQLDEIKKVLNKSKKYKIYNKDGELLKEFDGGTLRGADLRWADLSGADLRGADLRGANLYEADFMNSKFIGKTNYPNTLEKSQVKDFLLALGFKLEE